MYRLFFSTILAIFLLISCTPQKNHELIIAISKSKPDKDYGNYPKWIKKACPKAKIINMYELGVDSAAEILEQCHGLIISGGADVYPGWYGKLADTIRCGNFDHYRDTLEMTLIKKAIETKIPLLGICRGEQIINVTLGGSLIIDIPSDHDTVIKHRQKDWINCYHSIELTKGSFLHSIIDSDTGIVNSNHHQAIDQLAEGLMISSIARDGITESIEWKNKENNGFLMAVQWHPERLDTIHPDMSVPILKVFIQEALRYSNQ